jgi:hypothetical protein
MHDHPVHAAGGSFPVMTVDDPVPNERSAEDDELANNGEQVTARLEELPEIAISFVVEPKTAADAARPLALNWLSSAVDMLYLGGNAIETGAQLDPRSKLAIETVRRHFHTDKRRRPISELEAVKLVEANFRSMMRYLNMSDSIFQSADDETAAKSTRGYFGSGFTVAAYTYSMKAIFFTSDFPPIGPKCKAAVMIHQLAHFIDSRIRDIAGNSGPAYDRLDFDTALFNVHCYPNFAANATPPYLDERFGISKPNV